MVDAMPPRTRIQTVAAETRASVASAGGSARAAALPAEARAEIARSGAAKTNSAPNYAQRIRRLWAGLNRADRDEVRAALAGCKGLFPAPPKPAKSARSAPDPVDVTP